MKNRNYKVHGRNAVLIRRNSGFGLFLFEDGSKHVFGMNSNKIYEVKR